MSLRDHQKGDLGHHLRSHIHLTNCIHLKNHIHKHSPMLDERSLMRDLIALGRSRSLRDPSTSPSPPDLAVGRRRSTGMDHPRISWSSPTKMDVHEASSSSVRALGYQIEHQDDECSENNVTCGIPFRWSRIHHRGKSFLGKSFSCGLSDSRLKRGRNFSFSKEPEGSGLCSQFDGEALPLLTAGSGELGLFVDSAMKRENFTQKYRPRSFRDVVGQNLVVQALSNAVMQRKVGMLYVFYGPHGTGKTSCARVLAKALNCESLEHPRPCGVCSSCITHDLGQSSSLKEVRMSNFDFEGVMDLLDDESHYRVFIFDECDAFSDDCWSAVLKAIDRAPMRVVFMVVCSSLEVLPHMIASRCHKFFFPKLKDIDVIYALQRIATREGLEIDKDALKLIASRSDGSLRDAEMTLEQLSLLGQRISVTLVQQLVGMISDEKLVDLLDLALSADTVNTVKNLREIVETGVDPLALMPQLATVITDILAGSYDFTKERRRRRFFRRPANTALLSAAANEDMEKLRRALRILSEAEKQLRVSNDKLTWLTAALLQLAPERHYTLPGSSTDHSFSHTPFYLKDKNSKGWATKSHVSCSSMSFKKGIDTATKRVQAESSDSFYEDGYPVHKKGFFLGANAPLILPTSEIVEVDKRASDVTEGVEAQILDFCSEQRGSQDQNQCQSLMRSRVSLADVIQRTEGYTKCAEKLEQENLRLEPKTRNLRCWKGSRAFRRKFLCQKMRTRRSRFLMKLVCCGRCVSSRSRT